MASSVKLLKLVSTDSKMLQLIVTLQYITRLGIILALQEYCCVFRFLAATLKFGGCKGVLLLSTVCAFLPKFLATEKETHTI